MLLEKYAHQRRESVFQRLGSFKRQRSPGYDVQFEQERVGQCLQGSRHANPGVEGVEGSCDSMVQVRRSQRRRRQHIKTGVPGCDTQGGMALESGRNERLQLILAMMSRRGRKIRS
jgi:hypothetical protein